MSPGVRTTPDKGIEPLPQTLIENPYISAT